MFYKESNLKDVNRYIRQLMTNFEQQFGLATLNLPLDQYNHRRIDDELFAQYYAQVQNVSDHSAPSNENYVREYAINFFDSPYTHQNGTYITYEFVWFRKVVSITNDLNYATLIVSLLNVISLWLDLCILELHVYLDQILKLFLAVHRLLQVLRDWSQFW